MDCSVITEVDGDNYDTSDTKQVWVRNPPLEDADKIYNFTALACTLNEPEEGVAPTDSRNRPDQRLMEQRNYPDANVMKVRLEEGQRARRRVREAKILAEGEAG